MRRLLRVLFTVLRAVFILLLLIIPVPVGELFHRLTEKARRANPAQVVKKEHPD
ncbi:MAG TPA: hypothetical protein VGD87_03090 [Archangium sp.]|jgi:hypothetical protein